MKDNDETYFGDKKPTFMEYLIELRSYGELEFVYKGKKYVTLRLNNEYSFGDHSVWDRSKDFYVLFENGNIHNDQLFGTIEEMHENAKLNGSFVKDIFDEMTGIDELTPGSYHGFATHDHHWYGKVRGPARRPDFKNFP